ncbi:MAG: efflux RND transporter periplasmic adaptor subunit, partial [Stenotrophobium sp.]
ERRVDYYAPIDGYVAELGTRLGMQVTPGMSLFKLVDLSKVWVIAQVPEAQAAQVHVGAAVTAQSASLPGETFSGKVDYVYPDVEPTTRTLRLRFELDNRKLELHPGAYADVTIASGAAHEALLVPSEALIRSGRRTVVIVAQGDGGFTPVEVRTGQSSGERTEILDGLKAGQRVVASGQFLIDSEANLTGALKRLDDKQVNDNPAAATPENAPMNKQGDKTMPGGHTMPMPDGSTMTMPDQQPMQAPAEKSGSAP